MLGVAALAASGSGLVELPSAEQIVRTSTGALGALTYVVVGAFALAETGAFVGLVAPGEIVVVLGGVSAGTRDDLAAGADRGRVGMRAHRRPHLLFARAALRRSLLLAHGAGLGVTEARVAKVERVLSEHTAKTLVSGGSSGSSGRCCRSWPAPRTSPSGASCRSRSAPPACGRRRSAASASHSGARSTSWSRSWSAGRSRSARSRWRACSGHRLAAGGRPPPAPARRRPAPDRPRLVAWCVGLVSRIPGDRARVRGRARFERRLGR